MNVLIIDDHEIVRTGLKMIIEGEILFDTIRESETIEDGLNKVNIYEPDMVILDINLLGNNGLTIIEKAKEKGIKSKFIVFTSSSRKSDFEKAKNLGVEGYILKDSGIEDILYALKAIVRGRTFYDTKISEQAMVGQHELILKSLTERETEILHEIGKGLSNLEIAEKLFISENTVKKHITSLMAKIGVKRRTEVVLYVNKFWRRKSDFKNQ